MAEDLFVDVQYQGLELGRRLRLEDFAVTQAYLHHPTPMPVGSTLLVDAGDGLEISVQVARVNEQVAGSDKPAGMFVTPLGLTQSAQSWWDERVSEMTLPVAIVEVQAPEPSSSSEPAPAAASEGTEMQAEATQEDSADTQVMDAVSPDEVPAPEPDAGEDAPKGKKKRRRKKRPTKG